ncbi:MAG: restriction endonuclease [Opitutae bacterium]|nr:restriction endonuclease [Opitutae bacterium]
MVRLCSLRFTEWRKRDIETGKGEVDVLAASDTFVYSKWQIQCKNTSKVDVDVVAKETGMTFVTNADIIMIVTTGTFTNDARIYADRVSTVSRYYIILLDGGDIASIREDKTSVTHILDKHAKRTFARKEYGLTNIEFAEFSDDPT